MSETVLVTGAAGFIGSHTCRALLDAGERVVGLDNFDPFYDRRIKQQALDSLAGYPAFEFIEGDIRDSAVLDRVLPGAGAVVHLAARAGVRPSIEDPALYASVNVEGTVRVLEACRKSGVTRVAFGSSSSVYGDDTPVPFREDAAAVSPISPYAATKRAGELIAGVYAGLHGFRIAVLRFFTVYGARQRPDLAIHRFTRLLAEGRAIPQFGDGTSARDYTYVDDIVDGTVAAVRWTAAGGPGCEAFNLGGSAMVPLSRLVELIAGALGVAPRIERHPAQPGDVQRTCADVTKAKRVLGYAPRVAIEAGIPRFVEWYRGTHGRQL